MKRFLKVILVAACVFAFLIIALWYYFSFDLQWGVTWQTLTWGLPLLTAIILIPLCVVCFLKRRKWRWGLYGVGIAVVVLVFIRIILWNFDYMVVGDPENGPKETMDTEENRIMTLIIEGHGQSKYYHVIDPNTYWHYRDFTTEKNEKLKKSLIDEFSPDYVNNETILRSTDLLFNRFIEINRQPTRLTLKSSIKDGNYIDYDGKFSRYFDNGGGGWWRWHEFRPQAGSNIRFSAPAYDKETGLFIICIGWQGDGLMGEGILYVFKYDNGELKLISKKGLWTS